ncbi:vanadium-dependent haloperoxidase [Undibacterium amnicola]|uniref:Vanadium-dependent haloperoxidase n=1 Tax=Undibacterium amnicola TaxID=1834038 RepID=A0ABR6XQM6_9BURK|nr:vanadium-dependent haloperoxidase [Undibacterium amnicola]MBC3831217.1 vanadium-dependent haloperoxidase [Undibacterium amnicola]
MKKIICLMLAGVFAFSHPVAADTVSDWIEFSSRINSPLAPAAEAKVRPESARATTRVALAMFEALNAIDRRYESYVSFPESDKAASVEAAAVTAAYRVLIEHFPSVKNELNDAYAIAMEAIPNDAQREAGRQIGEQAAKAALAVGGIDPKIVQTPYRPHATVGIWTATDLPSIRPHNLAFFPWAISSAEALRSPPPPSINSARWTQDYDEVKRLGGKVSQHRTPHQSLMASYRIMPDILPSLRQTAETNGRSMVQNARMYARVYMAIDDSTLAMSAAKMHYNTWRPIVAIRNAANDGNNATQAEAGWESFLPTPNFPEYPCGHCSYAGSIAEIMVAEDGQKPMKGVRVASLSSPKAVIQILPSWNEWSQQVSDSRIYAGAHFRFANEAGENLGRSAGKAVLDKIMRPLKK